MLALVLNTPLDLAPLRALLSDRDELYLVWPDATYPFDERQWRELLLSRPGNRSYFVAIDGAIVGHSALLETDEPHVYAISYLFIRPDQRGRGFGKELMSLIEIEARNIPGIQALRLRVRTYNPRAAHVYAAAGFVGEQQDGTLVIMRKSLA
jgi:RimJ/RimL family protein N-acetyltransferase